ncbi:MAG: cation transporter [Spirochaetaceae bacterium]|nr:cation transporter [Spirochaetaceae bacterium]
MKKIISINGMTCPHCSMRVKKALEGIDGVTSADVSHENGTAVMELSIEVNPALFKNAVDEAGYTQKNTPSFSNL